MLSCYTTALEYKEGTASVSRTRNHTYTFSSHTVKAPTSVLVNFVNWVFAEIHWRNLTFDRNAKVLCIQKFFHFLNTAIDKVYRINLTFERNAEVLFIQKFFHFPNTATDKVYKFMLLTHWAVEVVTENLPNQYEASLPTNSESLARRYTVGCSILHFHSSISITDNGIF